MDMKVSQGQFDRTTKLLEQKIRDNTNDLISRLQAESEYYIEQLKNTKLNLEKLIEQIEQSGGDTNQKLNDLISSYNNFKANTLRINDVFDADGQFDGSRIRPLSIETAALTVGQRSQQLALNGIEFKLDPYATSGGGVLKWRSTSNSGSPNTNNIAGLMFHYGYGTNTDPKIYLINEGSHSFTSNDINKGFYIYAIIPKVSSYIYTEPSTVSEEYFNGYFELLYDSNHTKIYNNTLPSFDPDKEYYIEVNNKKEEIAINAENFRKNLVGLYYKNGDTYSLVLTNKPTFNSATEYCTKNSNDIPAENGSSITYNGETISCNNTATILVTADKIPSEGDSTHDSGLYIQLGYVSVELRAGNTNNPFYRKVDMTYGQTTINGRLITTGRIEGNGSYFDLDTGQIGGNITFSASQGSDNYTLINNLINGNSTVTTASTNASTALSTANTANNKIDNLEIGGRNLLRGTDTITITSSNYNWANGKFYKSGTGTIENVTLPSTPIPSITKGVRLTITTTSQQIGFAQYSVPLNKQTIVQSVWAKGTAGDIIILQPLWGSGTESGVKSFTIADSEWHRYEFSKIPNYEHQSGIAAGYVYFRSSAVGNSVYICADKLEYGNKATDWTPAPEDVDESIDAVNDVANAVNLRIQNIDNDTIFSVAEKQAFRIQFQEIVGTNINSNSNIPTSATLINNPTTYKNGSFMQHYKKISSSATNTLGALADAYDSLRTQLITYELYTNTDKQNFSRSTLQSVLSAYLKAESDIDFYAKNIETLEGVIDTGFNAGQKRIDCNAKNSDISVLMFRDMLVDPNMRMLVKTSQSNTANTVYFTFRNDGGLTDKGIYPGSLDNYVCRFRYRGSILGQRCYYPANVAFTIKYSETLNGQAVFECVDEEQFSTVVMLNKAIQGTTTVAGGLILTETIIAGSGDEQAGMSGAATDNCAFWAGGNVGSALNYNVPVVIMRDGNAKLGKLRIVPDGNISFDSEGTKRFEIRNNAVSVSQGYVTYNAGNQSNTPNWSEGNDVSQTTITGSYDSPNTAILFPIQELGHDSLRTFENVEVYIQAKMSFIASSLGTGGYVTALLQIYSKGEWKDVPGSLFRKVMTDTGVYSYNDTVNFIALYTSQTLTQSSNKSLIGLRCVFYKDSSAGDVSIEVSGVEVNKRVQWHYYQDTSKAKTQVGLNGMATFINNLNQFKVVSTDGDQTLTTTIKGETDIPGVLWAGRITAAGDVHGTPSFRNINVTLSKNGTSPSDTSLYNFKYTGISGMPIIIATPEITTADNYGWIAMVERLSTTNKTFSVRVKRDNAKVAGAFHLVILGTT